MTVLGTVIVTAFVLCPATIGRAATPIVVDGTEAGVIFGFRGPAEMFKLSSNWADPNWVRFDQMHSTTTRVERGFPKELDEHTKQFSGSLGGKLTFNQTLTVFENGTRVDSVWCPTESFNLRQLQYTVDILTDQYAGHTIVIFRPGQEPLRIDIPGGMTEMKGEYIGPVERIEIQKDGVPVLVINGAQYDTHIIDLRRWSIPVIRMAWNVFNPAEAQTVDERNEFSFWVEISW